MMRTLIIPPLAVLATFWLAEQLAHFIEGTSLWH